MTAIEDRIIKIMVEDFKVRSETVGRERTFDELGFDSLVIVELALAIDNEFGVALDDGDLSEEMTVAEAAEVVLAKGAVP
jgi:acyl carrier protein